MEAREVIVPLLPENDDENCETTEHENVPVQRPDDMSYHLFLSHCTADREFTRNLKDHLEENLKLKCLLADDDFRAGKTILENIERAITTSRKVLFVVSEDFLQSHFCKREVEFAFTHAANSRLQDFIIVLKLGSFDDSKLPLRFRALTYILGFGKSVEEIGEKIQREIANSEDSIIQLIPEVQCLGEIHLETHEESTNGREVFRGYPKEVSSNFCGGLECEFNDVTEDERTLLQSFDVPLDDCIKSYSNLQKFVVERCLLGKYALILSPKKCMGLFGLIMIGILAIMSAVLPLIAWGNGEWFDVSAEMYTMLAYFAIFITTSVAYSIYWYKYNQKVMTSLLNAAVLNIDYRQHKFFIIPTQTTHGFRTDILSISIFLYDMRPCWDFIEAKARQQWPMASSDEIKDLCEKQLAGAIKEHYRRTQTCPIPFARRRLHPTYEDRCCLCQLVKSIWVLRDFGMNAMNTDHYNPEETHLMKIVGDDDNGSQNNSISSEVVDTRAIPVMENAINENTSVTTLANTSSKAEEACPNDNDYENIKIFSSFPLPSTKESSGKVDLKGTNYHDPEETYVMEIIGAADYDTSSQVEETCQNDNNSENVNILSNIFLPSATEERSIKKKAYKDVEETNVMEMTGHDNYDRKYSLVESEVGDTSFSPDLESAIEGNTPSKTLASSSCEGTGPKDTVFENINIFSSFSLPLVLEETSMQDLGNHSAKEEKYSYDESNNENDPENH